MRPPPGTDADPARFVQVVPLRVGRHLPDPLTYAVPESLAERVRVGHSVVAPLGRRMTLGVVVGLTDTPGAAATRPLHALAAAVPLPAHCLQTAEWLAGFYHCTLSEALGLWFPREVVRLEATVRLAPDCTPDVARAHIAAARPDASRLLERIAESDGGLEPARVRKDRDQLKWLRAEGVVEASARVQWAGGEPADAEPAMATTAIPPPDEWAVLAEPPRGPICILDRDGRQTEATVDVVCAWAAANGRQALVLAPTAVQVAVLARRLARTIAGPVAVMQPTRTPRERAQAWRAAFGAAVVAGTRTAVFAALPRLGVIAVTGEHDDLFKAEERPHYDARRVARALGEQAGVPVVAVSAAPTVEWLHRAGEVKRLLERGTAAPITVELIDLRGRRPPAGLSSRARAIVQEALAAGDHVTLLAGQRGYAPSLLCQECGQAFQCPRCRINMRYARTGAALSCPQCGTRQPAPTRCPRCGSLRLRARGVGADAVAEAVVQFAPGASVAVADGEGGAQAQVVVTTLAFAPRTAGAVCVVLDADRLLHTPDVLAAEHTFQALWPLRLTAKRLAIQTHNPDHYAVAAVARGDLRAFYRRELAVRRETGFPPFAALGRIIVSGAADSAVAAAAQALAARVRAASPDAGVLGPAPAPRARVRDRARWHLLVKGPEPAIHAGLRVADAGAPAGVRFTVDMEPRSLL